ncbi:FecCD family ABC transporter permease [Actinokineospora diospyrosa]|uniref:Iron complex transport system permease protein n=1 Tax=Actinokineospora diospyrosa TaxID=103728 RepID=A0ABT1I681_9PSEU|nr:iron chelate uptake ABC transporter family permease subunit [Actinokineospora diospyrosa]MCP2268121.1 iron complex transport system permease protein [Actinokineospora diospyrosa]
MSAAILRLGPLSVRVYRRPLVVGTALLIALATLAAFTLTTGDYPATVSDVLRTIFGQGPPGLELVVNRFRLPRLLVAIGAGAALGAAGAVFQSVSRNPLGSPDVIGFTTGSATGAVFALLVFRDSQASVAVGAVVGGLAAAVIVYLLAYRRGVQGFRLILIGIGVSSILASVNSYLLTRASSQEARLAQLWLLGSVNGRTWQQVTPLWISLAVLVPLVLLAGRRMSLLEMGDATAQSLGISPERTRLSLVVVGVALTAVATAAAGPIGFIALAAPQVASRLTRTGGPGILPATLTGAVLLTAADLLGQRAIPDFQLPVGLATGAVGGVYLMWLLAAQWRATR